ncbi:hypothetical protein OIV83_002085 [Microbotryomycetes sp. JL201]|nr:hypothetical protein OIV83_002085 [Microbotryomycetes sp. JL201]
MDGAPYAKRQKITSTSRVNLNPEPLRQPELYQPGHDDGATGSGTSSAARRSSMSAASKLKTQENPHQLLSQPREFPHGNFQGYYTRRKLESTSAAGHDDDALDPRLQLVPHEWFKGRKVLDVGCNAGRVAIQVAQTLDAARVTAVDIDEDLIKQAVRQDQRHLAAELAWSRQQPLPHLTRAATHYDETGSLIDLSPAAAEELDVSKLNPSYFPLSMPRMFGFLPQSPELLTTYVDQAEVEVVSEATGRRGKRKVMPRERLHFPLNLQFKHVDWVYDDFTPDKQGYNVILALSVTKWIHLNGLNDGLFQFFRRAYETLLPGGVLILEPQMWSTYAKSVKTNPSLKANYDKLKNEAGWKAEAGDFERVLMNEIGFDKLDKLGETGDKGQFLFMF